MADNAPSPFSAPKILGTLQESTEVVSAGNAAKGRSSRHRYFIGGSDARIIMGEDQAALVRLWREKRGEAEPADLSGNLIVQLGLATEDLNRHWYEANTGQVITNIQRRVFHPALKWMAATLDGRVVGSAHFADGERRFHLMVSAHFD
jgi:predicted phage-related endonuclease